MPDSTTFCLHCGLSFTHKGDAGYCSGRCRKLAGQPWAPQSEQAILVLLDSRAPGHPLNPDEAARMLESDQSTKQWKAAIREVINAARRLARQDKIVITRKRKAVDPDQVRGVVRLRLK